MFVIQIPLSKLIRFVFSFVLALVDYNMSTVTKPRNEKRTRMIQAQLGLISIWVTS